MDFCYFVSGFIGHFDKNYDIFACAELNALWCLFIEGDFNFT